MRAARSAGSWLFAFSLRKPLAASSMAAAVQRSAMEASRQRFTLRQTRRTEPITFSRMLVQASDRRSSLGLQLSLLTDAPRCLLAFMAVEVGHVGRLRERPGVA